MSDAATTAGLVKAARAGDGAAMDTLYRRFALVVHGVALAYVGAADADDLTQDVFGTAINRLHIHMVVKEPGKNEYYIDDCEFDDDPLLGHARRRSREQRGGAGIVRVQRSLRGVGHIERDIVLGWNVPNYV